MVQSNDLQNHKVVSSNLTHSFYILERKIKNEECFIPKTAFDILKNAGFDLSEFEDDELRYIDQDSFVDLLMQFVRYSLPGFEWKVIGDDVENFNGFWDDNLNVQLGYGLFG